MQPVEQSSPLELPLLPLRDLVVFPDALQPFSITSERSMRALHALEPEGDVIVLATQRDPNAEDPAVSDLYSVGVTARVLKVLQLEEGHTVLIVLGQERVRLVAELQREPYLRVRVLPLPDQVPSTLDPELVPLMQNVRDLCTAVIRSSPVLSNELLTVLRRADSPGALANFVAATLPGLSTETRQELLETTDVVARLRRLDLELVRERDSLAMRRRIHAAVAERLGKQHHEMMLREQLEAIRKELGEAEPAEHDIAELRSRIEAAAMPPEAQTEAMRELARLEHMPFESAERSVARTYLDWLTALPWKRSSAAEIDVVGAQRVLDEDHFDLEKVKERVVEYLAVLKLRRELRGPILCFVGPPGVGKTSVGKSIARASGRRFVRLSLGGMRDEAEIRGHRRTYVGALPGQIVQGIRRAEVNNPVFMLDEIDKLGKDFRGDPAAALLEVLDPDQNTSFRDQYLDVPFDLSRVLFITTANVLDTIPPSLLDRMEIIELPGYSEDEKLEIARRYLVPRQLAEHGLLTEGLLSFTDAALRAVVRAYTREAGVRNLERAIASICRKQARAVAGGDVAGITVTPEVVRARLGVQRYHIDTEVAERTRKPGVAVALAWTPQGGDVLFVEAARMPRVRGEVTLTGQLGEVMQESAKAALSWVRANAERYDIPSRAFGDFDLHLHVPSGAVPKDGPSAGLVMVVALVSLFRDQPVRPLVALTGEITLSGQVLPVAGIKEKVLAARRSGIRVVVLPAQNEANVEEDVPQPLREGMHLCFVSTIEEALEQALAVSEVKRAPQSAASIRTGAA